MRTPHDHRGHLLSLGETSSVERQIGSGVLNDLASHANQECCCTPLWMSDLPAGANPAERRRAEGEGARRDRGRGPVESSVRCPAGAG